MYGPFVAETASQPTKKEIERCKLAGDCSLEVLANDRKKGGHYCLFDLCHSVVKIGIINCCTNYLTQ